MFEFFKKQKKSPVERPVFVSDILAQYPEEEWKNQGVFIQDYTRDPHELLVDSMIYRENKESPIIKVEGVISALEINDLSSINLMEYSGMIVLGEKNSFPLRFRGDVDEERYKEAGLARLILQSGERFPITMVGRLLNHGEDHVGDKCSLVSFFLRFGDYSFPSVRRDNKV